MIADFGALIHALADASVEFVIIDGAALVVHGSPRTTEDLDICYARSTDNLIRLSIALEPLHPYLRGVPPGLPFRLDTRTLTAGLNFTLTSDRGDIDLLGEVTGLGAFETVAARALPTTLIRTSRAGAGAGRHRDREARSWPDQGPGRSGDHRRTQASWLTPHTSDKAGLARTRAADTPAAGEPLLDRVV